MGTGSWIVLIIIFTYVIIIAVNRTTKRNFDLNFLANIIVSIGIIIWILIGLITDGISSFLKPLPITIALLLVPTLLYLSFSNYKRNSMKK